MHQRTSRRLPNVPPRPLRASVERPPKGWPRDRHLRASPCPTWTSALHARGVRAMLSLGAGDRPNTPPRGLAQPALRLRGPSRTSFALGAARPASARCLSWRLAGRGCCSFSSGNRGGPAAGCATISLYWPVLPPRETVPIHRRGRPHEPTPGRPPTAATKPGRRPWPCWSTEPPVAAAELATFIWPSAMLSHQLGPSVDGTLYCCYARG